MEIKRQRDLANTEGKASDSSRICADSLNWNDRHEAERRVSLRAFNVMPRNLHLYQSSEGDLHMTKKPALCSFFSFTIRHRLISTVEEIGY